MYLLCLVLLFIHKFDFYKNNREVHDRRRWNSQNKETAIGIQKQMSKEVQCK